MTIEHTQQADGSVKPMQEPTVLCSVWHAEPLKAAQSKKLPGIQVPTSARSASGTRETLTGWPSFNVNEPTQFTGRPLNDEASNKGYIACQEDPYSESFNSECIDALKQYLDHLSGQCFKLESSIDDDVKVWMMKTYRRGTKFREPRTRRRGRERGCIGRPSSRVS